MSDLDDEIAALRARLAELEARRAATPPAHATPISTPPKAEGPWRYVALVAAALAIVFVFAQLLGGPSRKGPDRKEAEAQSNIVDPATVKPLPGFERPDAATGASGAGASPSRWTYDVSKDEMNDRPTSTACVESTNSVALGWPYGSVQGRLCVRQHPRYGLDVYVSLLGDGQILCRSYEACAGRIRYDEAPASRFSALGPSDNSSNVVFLQGAKGVLARLQAAAVTRVELEYYQAGSQTLSFPTAGLEWPVKSQQKAATADN